MKKLQKRSPPKEGKGLERETVRHLFLGGVERG